MLYTLILDPNRNIVRRKSNKLCSPRIGQSQAMSIWSVTAIKVTSLKGTIA